MFYRSKYCFSTVGELCGKPTSSTILLCLCNLDHQYTGKFPRAASGGEEDVKQEIQVDDYEPFGMYLHIVGTSLTFCV